MEFSWTWTVGLLAALACTLPLGRLMRDVRCAIIRGYPEGVLPAPWGFDLEQWNEDVVRRTPGGEWLGRFEVVIFLIALLSNQWGLGASWLAFKLASK